jgi:hypothetical protein
MTVIETSSSSLSSIGYRQVRWFIAKKYAGLSPVRIHKGVFHADLSENNKFPFGVPLVISRTYLYLCFPLQGTISCKLVSHSVKDAEEQEKRLRFLMMVRYDTMRKFLLRLSAGTLIQPPPKIVPFALESMD